jgi:hypothetical protein
VISPDLLLQMKSHILPSYFDREIPKAKCLLVPYGNQTFTIFSGADILEQEAFADLLATLEVITQFKCAIEFQSKYLALAGFLKDGSLVIEIQKPDFVEQDGAINAKEFEALLEENRL